MLTPIITPATTSDLPEILTLQYLAYQSEAALFGTKDIPPLRQTLDEVVKEFEEGTILKIVINNNLFTSTRSTNNIRLYQKKGYKEFARKAVDGELEFVFMEKFSS